MDEQNAPCRGRPSLKASHKNKKTLYYLLVLTQLIDTNEEICQTWCNLNIVA